ncbi:zinc-ribbon domain-containing protein [Gordonia sp. p3-SID1431]|uniref:zinc-ribbon domain-containing protein n=1 Tax=Gordonia sp. p3-SID1431 TaxID=2916159 RepID=UPI0021A57372|nr:zinc-ribbon domain-containing protein [Gordonia sp. p3-SID1431]MCT1355488.1 zinc-ribbon domain-containing protein [Gordonia sp. p3-SID1431]
MRAIAEANHLEYLGPLTSPSLPDDPHHTRCRDCGKLSAERVGDMGWGCTCRRNPKRQTAPAKSPTANLLRTSDNEALLWWDHDGNPESLWETAKLKSPKTASWKCPECGHRFTAVIRETTRQPSCPPCTERRHREYDRLLADLRGKSVAEVPELREAWADEMHPRFAQVIPSGTIPIYRFRCEKGHYPRLSPLTWLQNGCPSCRANQTRAANAQGAAAGQTRLSPEIASQWHPDRNGAWTAAQASQESRRLAWWRDPVCGHEWQQTPRERDKYTRRRCPECDTILDSLAWHYPETAAGWAPENPITPWQVRPTDTNNVIEWICDENRSHRWTATPASMVNGAGCPECRTTGKSRVELDHLHAARDLFGTAASGIRVRSDVFVRRASWTVDILITLNDDQRVAVEYDGSYWHADKTELDTQKSLDLLVAGYTVVRLRESPLQALDIADPRYHEVAVYAHAPDPAAAMAKVRELLITNSDLTAPSPG